VPRRARPDPRLALVFTCVAATVASFAACSGGAGRPTRLTDGTSTGPPPVPLEGVSSAQIVTTAAVVELARLADPSVAACLALMRAHVPSAPVILRATVYGRSVTFRTASGRSLVGCDGVASGRSWCGRALGRLHAGRLADPRLDLAGCTTRRGDPVAFAWIEPARGTRYVALRQSGFAEVYAVLGALPVRVAATTGIDPTTSGASFDISEHDAAGRALRSYTIDARVAG
jgi:hypothetical protein